MVIRISDKTQNYSKVTKLLVKPLSFLGWIILGAICCGIGLLFVQPYPEATKAEVYLILKHRI